MDKNRRASTQLITDVLHLLNALDPSGLDPGDEDGAPADEYSPEATAIASKLRASGLITTEDINMIWADWFGESLAADTDGLADFVRDLNALMKRP
ncbi:hypothetical protein FBY40_0425 [Microbacterium sp. SLBN-154]|uniref:hypothetical protein n=1 Tax=Microbacterium sp. SLBN-154 TaxID=2768458 RepID=UPI0011522243|nr:hypothetical protein [Microbacterium sp. SLBN-154]TQK17942.1 hypothetical protein FBY40_0425 [Microbacterium sp. SLBN-154]